MWAIWVGRISEGFKVTGPFKTSTLARNYAEHYYATKDWHVVLMQQPAEAGCQEKVDYEMRYIGT